jgi:DNA repair photolyase
MDTEKRIDALRQMKEAGVRTGALLCPVIPHPPMYEIFVRNSKDPKRGFSASIPQQYDTDWIF